MPISVSRSQVVVFVLTYALYHAARKNLSGVKTSMTADWLRNDTHTKRPELFPSSTAAQRFLGTLDCSFMIALFFWGWLGDRMNPRNVVVFGMFASAVTLTLFGTVPYWLDFYSVPYYLFIYLLFGLVQACGWPNLVTIMANWFPKTNRGLIMGLWAACQPVGNIIGSLIVALLLRTGYQYTFLFNSIVIFIGGGVLLLGVDSKPRSELVVNYHEEDRESSNHHTNYRTNGEANIIVHRPISMYEALFLPSVLPYCLCNAALKFVNYAFFFWLPFYLTTKYGWNESEANTLAILYDVGGIIGSVAGGSISDKVGHRSPILMAMLITSLPVLFVYAQIGPARWLHIFLMTMLGVTISGPYNLIVGSIAVDLGSQQALAGNTEAMSTVTGLIDGMGSAGSAVGQLFVPIIQTQIGWVYVFYLFIVMNICAAVCLVKRFIHDLRLMLTAWRGGVQRWESEPLINERNED